MNHEQVPADIDTVAAAGGQAATGLLTNRRWTLRVRDMRRVVARRAVVVPTMTATARLGGSPAPRAAATRLDLPDLAGRRCVERVEPLDPPRIFHLGRRGRGAVADLMLVAPINGRSPRPVAPALPTAARTPAATATVAPGDAHSLEPKRTGPRRGKAARRHRVVGLRVRTGVATTAETGGAP